MIKKLLLTAVAMITLGAAAPANAQQDERRERGGRQEQRHDRREFGQGRPHHGHVRPSPGWYHDDHRHYKKRHHHGRYYNNGHYYNHRYRDHGGWRYR